MCVTIERVRHFCRRVVPDSGLVEDIARDPVRQAARCRPEGRALIAGDTALNPVGKVRKGAVR